MSISVTSVFNIMVTPKITYSYLFIINFFFFMLKKILNIYKYSIFNCFSFFSRLKRFLISVIAVWFSSFLSLKGFLISLIIFLLQDLNFPSLCCEKNYFFKKRIKVYYTPSKSIRKYYL